jgi:hypothetical protein
LVKLFRADYRNLCQSNVSAVDMAAVAVAAAAITEADACANDFALPLRSMGATGAATTGSNRIDRRIKLVCTRESLR